MLRYIRALPKDPMLDLQWFLVGPFLLYVTGIDRMEKPLLTAEQIAWEKALGGHLPYPDEVCR